MAWGKQPEAALTSSLTYPLLWLSPVLLFPRSRKEDLYLEQSTLSPLMVLGKLRLNAYVKNVLTALAHTPQSSIRLEQVNSPRAQWRRSRHKSPEGMATSQHRGSVDSSRVCLSKWD